MLMGKLYKVNAIDLLPQEGERTNGKKYSIYVSLESTHDIFKGHFPGNPILPGVCQVEMVREIASEILGSNLLLSEASHVKYINMINPLKDPVLRLNLELTALGQDESGVSAEVFSAECIFMKMKGRLKGHNCTDDV